MKYAVIIASLALGAFALPQDQASTITSAPPAASYSATPQQKCAEKCDAADVTCKAECFGVARPNTSQILETTECAMKCDQGSGSPEDTKKYADCQQACFASFFPSSQTLGGPAPASNAAATGTAATGSPTGTEEGGPQETGGDGGDSEESQTGTAADSKPTGAANSNKAGIAGAGLAGLALAVFGL